MTITPPARYRLEVRTPLGVLLCIIKEFHDATLEQAVNTHEILSFTVPNYEESLLYITRANEIWVRDMDTDTVIAKTRLKIREDSRV
jgi:hypothetical protein